MERPATAHDYHQGIAPPYTNNFNPEGQVDHSPADGHNVAAGAHYQTHDVRNTYPPPPTDYGVYAQAGRADAFPDHLQRNAMASHHSAAYPYNQYGNPAADIHAYQSPHNMYPHYGHAANTTPVTPTGPQVFSPTTTQNNTRQYAFVPITGAGQHKRPRRRYEEIERIYKCGWQGCEKAYGTLNHLNAHVTMQSHGQKRIPEEFKEIRKEWKDRKKREAEEKKKMEEQSNAAAATQSPTVDTPSSATEPHTPYARAVQLPPLSASTYAYSPTGNPQQTMDYSGQIYGGYPPHTYPASAGLYTPSTPSAGQPNTH